MLRIISLFCIGLSLGIIFWVAELSAIVESKKADAPIKIAQSTGDDQSGDEKKKAEKFSEKYQVAPSAILELRSKHSWEDIERILAIAQKSGQSIDQVSALKEMGMSWNEIAQRFGLNMEEIEREIGKSDSEAKTKADPDPSLNRDAPSGNAY